LQTPSRITPFQKSHTDPTQPPLTSNSINNVVSLAQRPSTFPVAAEMRTEVEDLLHHPVFLETRFEIHHSVRKCDHLLRTARFAWMIAGAVKANRRTCARAGLLHDIHSRLGSWSTHGAIAASVASEIGENKAVCDAIVPHMFPLGPAPKTKEAWVITVADKVASLADTFHFILHAFSGSSLKQRKLLLASDRFVQHKHRTKMSRAA